MQNIAHMKVTFDEFIQKRRDLGGIKFTCKTGSNSPSDEEDVETPIPEAEKELPLE